DQGRKADEEERGKPEPGYLVTELCKERYADEQQKHERPGRDHARHLAKLATEDLNVVDIGGLEADHRGERHHEDGSDIFPAKAGEGSHIAQIKRNPDQAQQGKIDEAYRTGDHDWRVGAANF